MSELWNLSPVESGLLAQRVDHTQQAATTALQGSERQDGNNGENNNRDKEVNGVPGVSAAGLQAEASDRGQSAREEEGTSANGVYSEKPVANMAPCACCPTRWRCPMALPRLHKQGVGAAWTPSHTEPHGMQAM